MDKVVTNKIVVAKETKKRIFLGVLVQNRHGEMN